MNAQIRNTKSCRGEKQLLLPPHSLLPPSPSPAPHFTHCLSSPASFRFGSELFSLCLPFFYLRNMLFLFTVSDSAAVCLACCPRCFSSRGREGGRALHAARFATSSVRQAAADFTAAMGKGESERERRTSSTLSLALARSCQKGGRWAHPPTYLAMPIPYCPWQASASERSPLSLSLPALLYFLKASF